MKILAIRGRNLASLAGDFEIDFGIEPLASAGLFALCGPTGAGKSTLLDALCLALYAQTPRLQHAGTRGVAIRDTASDTLAPYDPATLLRRGCSEGHAEVDFRGHDGERWRARWSVRRARNRSEGKLQPAEMSLHALASGQPVGGKKTEVLTAIEARVGLNFSQFTRAVLLAQNEFGAFLRADDSERASLLETLTGTELYGALSSAAYRRAQQETDALASLQARLADQQPLTASERTALDAELAQAQADCTLLTTICQAARAALDWYAEAERLETLLREAGSTFEQARAAQADAAPRRAALQQIEAAQAARHLEASARYSAEQSVQAIRHAQDAANNAEQARAAEHIAHAAQLQAREQQAQADRAWNDAQPALREAHRLDGECERLQREYADAAGPLKQAEQTLETLQKQHQQAENERHQRQHQLAAIEDWLNEHTADTALAHAWPRLEALLPRAADERAEAAQAQQVLAATQAQLTQREAELKQAQAPLTTLRANAECSTQRLQQARDRAAAFDAGALAETREHLQQRSAQLDALARHDTEQTRRADDIAARQARALDISAERDTLQQHLDRIAQALPAQTAARTQARQMLHLTECAADAQSERLRAELRDGQPCPVCGATEHPWTEITPELRTLLARQQAALAQLETDCNALLGEQSALQERQRTLNVESVTLTATLRDLRAAHDAASRARTALPLATMATDAGALRTAQDDCAQALEALKQQERDSRTATQTLEQARSADTQAQRALSDAQEAITTAEHRQQLAENDRDNAQNLQRLSTDHFAATLAAIDAMHPLADWRQRWQDDAAAALVHWQQIVDAWRAQQAQAAQLHEARQQDAIEQQRERSALEQAGMARAQTAQALDAADRRHRQALDARAALFAGQATAAVEQALRQAVDEARNHVEAAEQRAQQCTAGRASAEEAARQTQAAQDNARQAAAAAAAELATWLAAQPVEADGPLTRERLHQRLAVPPEARQREAEALDALDRARAQAQTVVDERRQRCDEHLRSRPAEDADSARATLAVQEPALQQANEACTQALVRQREDEHRRQTSAALLADGERQQRTQALWAGISGLIGSADGKKFRNFAQQLTLDALLGYANHHLNELARRYRLQRIADTLALQVIDRDMGDEVRSVHSLSGGESFLVSLALALGLASLSSNRVRVESLFIDEGFGSLDADTLRVAMDALDRLQALGRKVCVISHVQEMTERIGTRIDIRRRGGGRSEIILPR